MLMCKHCKKREPSMEEVEHTIREQRRRLPRWWYNRTWNKSEQSQ